MSTQPDDPSPTTTPPPTTTTSITTITEWCTGVIGDPQGDTVWLCGGGYGPTNAPQTLYGQCGGEGYTGPSVCATSLTCSAIAPPYYSQCLPSPKPTST
ncbi:hypothetical protein SISNIDRAFT_491270 [Sistotremastrum niveocremeum HHB9708]|uniref:CBM1 domain-containing protein n=1 Tax=Sistotremastrum niveocremeum HHB9708 TaxID=1314777 RepID=A0A164MZN0_9AGAM|nr:hypothetical protein SISNIDRAFT_491270 [Sistotremastrum niveocremeum HHB9708]